MIRIQCRRIDMIPVILGGNVTFTSGMTDNRFAETDAKDGLYLIIGDVDGSFELFNRFDIVGQITWPIGEEET